MKIISLLTVCLLIISSCTLDGVKNENKKSLNDWLAEDTISSQLNDILSDPKIEIKQDTLENGSVNNLVWNGDGGLRIEWTKKQIDNKVNLHDVVMVNYTCRVARGEIYDSNKEIGKPVPIKTGIGQLIKGWEIALQQMHVADEGRIMIPSKLAYGEAGLIGVIPQNADIIVDIEIVSRIEPIELLDGVKVYKYESAKEGIYAVKNQAITFNYFAFTQGAKAGMYDNSYENGTPFVFKFENDNVVEGLHIGFSKIKANEKAYIEIPAAVAYGSKGLVDLVPKNTPIVFDVRVESIK